MNDQKLSVSYGRTDGLTITIGKIRFQKKGNKICGMNNNKLVNLKRSNYNTFRFLDFERTLKTKTW